jgi:hypothetical protein
LGHQVALGGGAQALRLDFQFQGRVPWQAVLDPTNLALQHVLGAVVKADAYFILVVGAHGATAFRADADEEERRRFHDICRRNPSRMMRSERFIAVERALEGRSTARAQLVWIGQDDPSILDLSETARHELRPVPR